MLLIMHIVTPDERSAQEFALSSALFWLNNHSCFELVLQFSLRLLQQLKHTLTRDTNKGHNSNLNAFLVITIFKQM